eukprot:4349964-Amphidinium_carterae.2
MVYPKEYFANLHAMVAGAQWLHSVLKSRELGPGMQILVETYLKEEDKPIEERLEVYLYFGTFSRALLSMFELTMANWPPICRLLMENVSELWM